MKIDAKQYLEYVDEVYETLVNNGEYITELDSKLGDGDHYANMKKGFENVIASKEEMTQNNFGELLTNIGKKLMSGVGGSSGVLLGSAYINAGKNFQGEPCLSVKNLETYFQSMYDAIAKRGSVEPGEKTMLDPLFYALNATKDNSTDYYKMLLRVREAAKKGFEETKNMKAKKGRGVYKEDKGVGLLDAGAYTMFIQIDTLIKTIIEKGENK